MLIEAIIERIDVISILPDKDYYCVDLLRPCQDCVQYDARPIHQGGTEGHHMCSFLESLMMDIHPPFTTSTFYFANA